MTQSTKPQFGNVSRIGQISQSTSLTMQSANATIFPRVYGSLRSGDLQHLFGLIAFSDTASMAGGGRAHLPGHCLHHRHRAIVAMNARQVENVSVTPGAGDVR
jgi:hypothetical protein